MISSDIPHLRVLPCIPATTFEEAVQALKTLPGPWWLRGRHNGNQLCVRLQHENDLTLAWHKACAQAPGMPVQIQPAVSGACYRVLGALDGAGFRATHFLTEEVCGGLYRVPMACVLPPGAGNETGRRVLEAAAAMAQRWPGEPGPLCVELVDDGTHLFAVQCHTDGVQGGLSDALRLFFGFAMQADRMRGDEEITVSTLEPGLAAAVCWLETGAGVVSGVTGVEEAKAYENVLDIRVGVREGDTVRHVADTATRDQLGYVLATGDTAEHALQTAHRARAAVRIDTSPILEPAED